MLSKVIRVAKPSMVRCFASRWAGITQAPPDAILGLNEQFKADKFPGKISLGVGAYRDDNGKPVILPCVAEAERRLAGKSDHEYPPIQGLPDFNRLAAEFVYGADSSAIKEDRVAVCQALSGTGSLRLLGDFFKRNNGYQLIYVPTPTWPNHFGVMENAGVPTDKYTYLDAENKLNMKAILESISSAKPNSAFLFHACAHNPTGVDPTHAQWKQISDAIKAKGCGIVFDCAYQGFASGDMEGDAYAIRLFVKEGHQVCLAQSFAKNFGLYGERCGAASIVCADKAEKERVLSQMKTVARRLWSNPPLYGARIVQTVLGDPKLKAQWYEECAGMAHRIIDMRKALVDNLAKAGSKRDWTHITSQIGMFAYTGLTKEQVQRCISEYHIYLTMNGRISIAGLNTKNVAYVAKAFHEVTKN